MGWARAYEGGDGDHDSVLALRVTSTGVAARSISPHRGLASSLAQPRTGRATQLPWRISRWDDSSPTSSAAASARRAFGWAGGLAKTFTWRLACRRPSTSFV